MRWFNLLAMLLLLSGCAETQYEKGGKSVRETEKDLWACEEKILADHHGLRNETAQQKQAYLDECMRDKGYRLKQ